MTESLDAWYQRELDYFRNTAAEFATRFPKIANRLSLSASGTRDPHVERLIQAFAYLNARTRHKLDDGFPELVDAMLGILYPHLLAPVPAVSIVGFGLNPAQKDQTGGHLLKAGTYVETERVRGFSCPLRTCYPVQLFPLDCQAVRLLPRPFSGPPTPARGDAQSALRIEFKTLDPKLSLSAFTFDKLRFYLNITNFEKASRLLELVLTETLEVVITGTDPSVATAVLPSSCVRAVGFGPDEALLAQQPRTFPGYRLLTEYFVLPQKFLFFDICGLTPDVRARLGNRMEISLLLRSHAPELESSVSKDSVRTGCTPVINLFRKTADAIPLHHRSTEYRIIADARAEESLEIFSVDAVSVDDQDGSVREFQPFYSVAHASRADDTGYWHAVRRPGPVEGDTGTLRNPTEMYCTLVDSRFSPLRPGSGLLQASVTCFNRDLPEELARQRDVARIGLELSGGRGPVSEIRCLVPPTATLRRHLGRRNLWPLISQLSLNHLSLCNTPDARDAVREILTLNDPRESAQTRNLIEGLVGMTTEPCVQRLSGAFARGTQINLLLDDENYAGDSAFLFAAVLNQFFAMYTSLNSFTRVTATTHARRARGLEPWKWPAQAGNRNLI
jgi:type VI secretion system protein ImpG